MLSKKSILYKTFWHYTLLFSKRMQWVWLNKQSLSKEYVNSRHVSNLFSWSSIVSKYVYTVVKKNKITDGECINNRFECLNSFDCESKNYTLKKNLLIRVSPYKFIKMFVTNTIITNKSWIIQKKIVPFVNDDETVLKFVNSKRNGEVVKI